MYLASLKTLNRRNDLKAEMAPPPVSPEAPVKTAGGEMINSSRPLITMKPSKRLKLSRAYSLGPSAANYCCVVVVNGRYTHKEREAMRVGEKEAMDIVYFLAAFAIPRMSRA